MYVLYYFASIMGRGIYLLRIQIRVLPELLTKSVTSKTTDVRLGTKVTYILQRTCF
jgi:hypothetical protein